MLYFTLTDEQLERLNALRDQAQKGEITGAEVGRKRLEITAEGLDPLTAAKYFLSKGSIGSIELEVGREYARALGACSVMKLCHRTIRLLWIAS